MLTLIRVKSDLYWLILEDARYWGGQREIMLYLLELGLTDMQVAALFAGLDPEQVASDASRELPRGNSLTGQ